MNWFKKAQLETTLPYFQELENEGELVPDQEKLNQTLEQKFNTKIVKDIGFGDSGVAYLLTSGDVLKITTNVQEAKVADWLISNPNPHIIEYKAIWRDGDLFYIIMEKLDSFVKDDAKLSFTFNNFEKILEQKKCYDISCAINVLKSHPYSKNHSLLPMILTYLSHLSQIPNVKIFDFLNPQNIGIKSEKLKFFDIT